MKVFFSHAHADNELVAATADRVGRAFVNVDLRTFRTGDDLVVAMESAIQESSVFVFFASRTSLDSMWVDFEQREAHFHQAAGRIRRMVTVLTDDTIKVSELPKWLQRSLFVTSRSPGPIARIVRQSIDDIVGESQSRHFVGRADETAQLQAALVPFEAEDDAALIVVRGLPGIGRRTLLKRVVKDTLGYDRVLSLRVEAADTKQTLHIKLQDLVEPHATPEESLKFARSIEAENDEDAVRNIVQLLQSAQQLKEIVAFFDEGGLLTNDGQFQAYMADIIGAITAQPSLMAAAITNRRPVLSGHYGKRRVAVVDVAPLTESEVRQLLALLSRSQEVELPGTEVQRLVKQAAGYPPAVNATVQTVRTYGAQLTSQNQLQKDFSPRPLHTYLRGLRMERGERKLLSILAKNSPLPLQVLIDVAELDDNAGAGALRALIDASLATPVSGTAWYSISEPVADFVDREYPSMTIGEYELLARSLRDFLDSSSDDGPYLDISRVYYRALAHAGKKSQRLAYSLASDWLRLAEEFYHDRNYEKSLEYALLVVGSSAASESLSWTIRSRVKLGDYTAALTDIERLQHIGDTRDSQFYRGFLERSRGRHRDAIRFYERARALGRGGLALERDLAECYYQVGDLEKATFHIEEAQAKQADNPYVVTLRIKIACRRGDEVTARALLELLDQVDRPDFAAHRRARVDLEFGELPAALLSAERSVAGQTRPSAEALSNLALCRLMTGDLAGAESTTDQLEALYARRHHDVILGLRARLALANENFDEALSLTESFHARDSVVHGAIRRDALHGLLQHTNMSADLRSSREEEVGKIEAKLSSVERTDIELGSD